MIEFLTARGYRRWVKRARDILDRNWTGGYTKPSPALYPHQWNWDSCFIAMGYTHYDETRAMTELRSLLSHQWENGMIPQIVFNPSALGNYFPEPDFWQVPGGRLTSGITMPPLHATACLTVYRKTRNGEDARAFLKEVFPHLVASHRYFYRQRDPRGTGLVYIRHPWESGLDNSPSWDPPLRRIQIEKDKLPPYRRKDLKHGIPVEQRPKDEDYDRYVYLVDLFRRLRYDEAAMFTECPFLVQDVLFNAILCRSDGDLAEIAGLIGEDPEEMEEWRTATDRALRRDLWSEERGQFDPLDMIAGEKIPTCTASSFMPLFSSSPSKDQAEELYRKIDSASFCALHQGNCFTIPNYDMSSDDFDSRNYWRGPVWININWMLSQGLRNYGYREKSDAMKKDLIQLPIRFGFHEYFDSVTGKGYGSDSFSWTAALFLDLVNEYYEEDRHRPSLLGWWNRKSLPEKRVLNDGAREAVPPGEDPASDLMESIGNLKRLFYDTRRGRVDYRTMGSSEAYGRYRRRAAALKDFNLETLETREGKMAFWINLYNTLVIQGIIELGIDDSVREISNFFKSVCYRIGPHNFSADDIEHGILRSNARPPYRLLPVFSGKDPRKRYALESRDNRIHFALVCGSRSCAPIRFYEPAKIDEQLDLTARNFVNSSEVVILPEDNSILLSQIFQWYSRDFGGREGVFAFLLKYLYPGTARDHLAKRGKNMKVEYLFYDWNLNH